MAQDVWDPFGDSSDAQTTSKHVSCAETTDDNEWAVFETSGVKPRESKSSDSEWQDFSTSAGQFGNSQCTTTVVETIDSSGSSSYSSQLTLSSEPDPSSTVFQSIFCCDCNPPSGFASKQQELITHQQSEFLNGLQVDALSVCEFSWSHSVMKDHLLLAQCSLFEETSPTDDGTTELLYLDEFDIFQWNQENKSDTKTEEKVSFSPELFSHTRVPLDSPIQLEFDYDKAILGLSLLTVEELTMMRDELSSKVKMLSSNLVTALQVRDMVTVESDTKNKFIAALLKVKDRRHTHKQQRQDRVGISGVKNWGRPRSLSHRLEWMKKRKSLVLEEEKSNDLLMHTVVPYKHNKSGVWNNNTLKHWTKILQAMSEGSSELPKLLSAYLQSQVLPDTGDQSATNTASSCSSDQHSSSSSE